MSPLYHVSFIPCLPVTTAFADVVHQTAISREVWYFSISLAIEQVVKDPSMPILQTDQSWMFLFQWNCGSK